MKTKMIIGVFLAIGLFSGCNQSTGSMSNSEKSDNALSGKWVKTGPAGSLGLDFTNNGLIEVDFDNDQTIDVTVEYALRGDTIEFIDKDGKMCQNNGKYKIYQTDYYLAFDMIEDDCNGRIKTTMGYWTKPNYDELIQTLESEISSSPEPQQYLNRGRIYMAIGKSQQAREDFDRFILTDTTNARVYLNRAATQMPYELSGVVLDCNRAIDLDPDNKNAYFLRGLARYELGEKELGCADFSKAIELGFTILRDAEQEKCAEYWKEE
jgi:tetratricopeptide (TPR) repeat protein